MSSAEDTRRRDAEAGAACAALSLMPAPQAGRVEGVRATASLDATRRAGDRGGRERGLRLLELLGRGAFGLSLDRWRTSLNCACCSQSLSGADFRVQDTVMRVGLSFSTLNKMCGDGRARVLSS